MKKFYVVWKGGKPGIYNTWAECKAQVDGQKGAVYKSFESLQEAQTAWSNKPEFKKTEFTKKEEKPVTPPRWQNLPQYQQPLQESLCVDASCLGNPGKLEYRGVYMKTGREIFRMGPYEQGTNNIGEFLAIVHALALLKQQNSQIPIYSDSQNAISWVWDKEVRTTLKPSAKNKELFNLLDRAIIWLKTNIYPNSILKWKTHEWGEIPADFGRK